MKEKITYFMDPLCGWSYANSQNFLEFFKENKEIYEFEIVPGGIKINCQASFGGGDMADYVKKASTRIHQRTGAIFSVKYFKNLASNPMYLFDSKPSSKAIVTMKLLAEDVSIPFAHRLQTVQFYEGKNINDDEVLAEIAGEFGIKKKLFSTMYRSELVSDTTNDNFSKTRRMKVDSFPSLYISAGDKFKNIGNGYMSVEEMRKAVSFCYVNLLS